MTSRNVSTRERERGEDTFPNDFRYSGKGYEYMEMDQTPDIVRLRVSFFIRKDRLDIIEKVMELKCYGLFSSYIEEAIMNMVEADLNSPESIAHDLCKKLLKEWMIPISNSKSLQNPTSSNW